MCEEEIKSYIKKHSIELGINKNDEINANTINTGKRNNCYIILSGKRIIFCKVFNPQLRFASQFDKTRYFTEKSAINFLAKQDFPVPSIIYSDDENEILFEQFIEGSTLRQELIRYPEKERTLVSIVLDNLSKLHNLKVQDEDFANIDFRRLETEDYIKFMIKTLALLYDFLGIKNVPFSEIAKSGIRKIGQHLAKQELRYGHFELHGDNIIVDNNDVVHFVDFEKFHPHIPQIDLISFLMGENMKKDNICRYIDEYIKLNGINSKDGFLYTLDCANIFYNLKIINMIIRNILGYETRWEEVDGKKVKIVEKTQTNFGINWNKERNENIYARLKNILNFNFSQNKEIIDLKKELFGIVIKKSFNEMEDER